MTDFRITILGNGSAVPTSWHNPTSQLVYYCGNQFMIDCGEGAQMQMIKYKTSQKKLDHILISHMHGDHYYGLIGLLNSMHLMRRERQLTIFAPRDLEKILTLQLQCSNTRLYYPLQFCPLEDYAGSVLYEDERISVSAFPLKHSVPVWGYLFKEKEKQLRIDKKFVNQYNPAVEEILQIKQGANFIAPDGKLFKNDTITLPPLPRRSYAFCSDTAYLKSTGEYVNQVDLLYHESTFESDRLDLATKTLHSTAEQAAMVAKEAGAGKLLLGHYSARYFELDGLLEEARKVFPSTELSEEGKTYFIP